MKATEIDKHVQSEPAKKDIWLVRIAYVVVITAAIFSFWFFYRVFFPAKILEIRSQPIPVVQETVPAGGDITLQIDYCKSKALPSDIEIGFVNGQLDASFTTFRNLEVGCHSTTFDVNVPITLKPDDYHIEMIVMYPGGLLTNDTYSFSTERFKVIAPVDDPRTVVIQQCVDSAPSSVFRENNNSPSPQLIENANEASKKEHSSNQNPDGNNNGGGENTTPEPRLNLPDMLPNVIETPLERGITNILGAMGR